MTWFHQASSSLLREVNMHQLNRWFVVFSVLGSLGCGAAQMNETQQRSALYSVHAAELEGAAHQPRPARLLDLAHLEMMRAARSFDNGDEGNGTLLLECAKADAELARQLARTQQEEEKARVAWSELGSTELFGPGERDGDQEQKDQQPNSVGGTR